MARKTLKEVDLELLLGVCGDFACPNHPKYIGHTRPRVLSCAGCWEVYLGFLWDVERLGEEETKV